MKVYILAEGVWQYVHGPADLAGRRGDLKVTGTTGDEVLASKWAVAIGVAVAYGASVRREESV